MKPWPWEQDPDYRRPHRRVRPKPMPLPEVDPRRLPLDHPALGPFETAPLVRRLRQRIRVSQRELAWRARVAHTTVSRVESGDLAPSLALLQRLLAVGALHLVVVDEQGRVILPLPDDDDEPRRRGHGAAHRVWERPYRDGPARKPNAAHARAGWEPPDAVKP
ncbi:MAG TPA: helix-turn-helix domain-containing protein [Micromonosporaceae bacterium]|nr:helix-turn-helix domain-containing protein [Micromonosporaceae bacterium]